MKCKANGITSFQVSIPSFQHLFKMGFAGSCKSWKHPGILGKVHMNYFCSSNVSVCAVCFAGSAMPRDVRSYLIVVNLHLQQGWKCMRVRPVWQCPCEMVVAKIPARGRYLLKLALADFSICLDVWPWFCARTTFISKIALCRIDIEQLYILQ